MIKSSQQYDSKGQKKLHGKSYYFNSLRKPISRRMSIDDKKSYRGAGSKVPSFGRSSASKDSNTYSKLVRYIFPPFGMENVKGKILKGDSKSCVIYCYPLAEGSFEKNLFLKIKNAVPEQPPMQLTLKVKASWPKINFDDNLTLFQEFDIRETWEKTIEITNNGFPYGIFCELEKKIYFGNAIVGTTVSYNLFLQSKNHLGSNVELLINGNEVFSVGNKKSESIIVHIPPYESMSVPLNFSPQSLKDYEGTLVLVLGTPFQPGVSSAAFPLCGNGNFPSIECFGSNYSEITPNISRTINFELVHIDSSQTQLLTIRNIGFVVAEVLLEVSNPSDVFSICCEDTITSSTTNDRTTDEPEPNTIYQIVPNKTISFEIKFKPDLIGIYSSTIIFHVVHNPFESFNIKLNGEAYQKDLLITGLRVKILQNELKESNVNYDLNFGTCFPMKKYLKKFIINNNSYGIIRFEINNRCTDIFFIPSVGHILPSSAKEVEAILISTTSKVVQDIVDCIYQEITYEEDMLIKSNWDNSAKIVRWLEDKKFGLYSDNTLYLTKMETELEEPNYSANSHNEKVISINVDAIIDSPILKVDPTSIDFSSVLVGQSMEKVFEISNVGRVATRFRIFLKDEISKTPNIVPEDIEFTFGNFDYDMSELPKGLNKVLQEENSYRSSVTTPDYIGSESSNTDFFKNVDINKFGEKWNSIKTKQLNIIYQIDENRTQTPEIADEQPNVEVIESETRHSSMKGRNYEKSSIFSNSRYMSSIYDKPGSSKSFPNIFKELKNSYLTYGMEHGGSGVGACPQIDDECSFKIDINSGQLEPSESISCKVTFRPRHIEMYKAILGITCMDTDTDNISVPLEGLGFIPLCHVEIDTNDRRYNEIVTNIKSPPNTKIIFIRSFSCDSIIKKFFNVYNVSELPYHFKWICKENSNCEQKLKCHTAEGVINPREKYEMLFSLCPIGYGISESLWTLYIKEFLLEQSFLFIATIKEPSVDIKPKTINLKPTVKGIVSSSELTLFNNDDIEIDYSIDEQSLVSLNNNSVKLSVSPVKGSVSPKGSNIIKIEFTPQIIGEFRFNVLIIIANSPKVLTLRVISRNININAVLTCLKEDFERINVNDSQLNQINTISVGKVTLKIPYTLSFTISNLNDIHIYFECYFPGEMDNKVSLNVDNKCGIVLPNKSQTFNLKITVLQRCSFKKLITIKICKGPNFHMMLTGSSTIPLYEFSFNNYDFGCCTIQKSDPLMNSVVLEFFNKDSDPILVETNGCESVYYTNFKSLIIEPRAVHKILITFNPKEKKKYPETLKFIINNSYENEISLTGEGDYFRLEVVNPDDELVDLGLVTVGKTVSRDISIVNSSQVSCRFSLHVQEKSTDACKAKLFIEPTDLVKSLEPGKCFILNLKFHATERLKNAHFSIIYNACEEKRVLFVVKVSVIDYEFSLDQTNLFFGATAIGCTNTLKFGLCNTGDIGTRFNFSTELISDVFIVKPVEGYSTPGSTTVIEVTFIPTTIMQYHNNLLLCMLENYHSLSISLTGIGVHLPLPIANIKFKTEVRKEVTNHILLHNRTCVQQIFSPIVVGEYFSGSSAIKVPPQGSVNYDIFYKPLTQTRNQFHMGNVFCPYPNGEGCLYKLLGTALPPNDVMHLTWHCYAREKKCGIIPVENWSSFSETYSVKLKCVSVSPPCFYRIGSDDVISIPSKQSRNYNIEILCYRNCKMDFKVIFKNINSREYMTYKLSIISKPQRNKVVKKLTTFVREQTSYRIPLFNPMDKATIFSFISSHPDIKPRRKKIRIEPKQKVSLKIKYLPLKCGFNENVKIEICNSLLGSTVHLLNLEAKKPRTADDLHVVKANLGNPEKFYLPIKNPTSTLVTCFAEVHENDLIIENELFNIAPNKTVRIPVRYDPSSVGVQLLKVKVITSNIGTFRFLIKAVSYPPKPQGPLKFQGNINLTIQFKNVLSQQTNFICEINSTEFHVVNNTFSLIPKEVKVIEVEYVKINQSSVLVDSTRSTCKLTIITTNVKPTIRWIYYLQAEQNN